MAVAVAPTTCLFCDEALPLRKMIAGHSQLQAGRQRKYCSRQCNLAALDLRRRSTVGQPIRLLEPPASPHRVPTLADLPERCPRCTGLMRRTQGGVVCALCGHDVYAISALSRLEESAAGWV